MSEFKGTKGEWEVKKIHGDLKVIGKGSYEKLGPGMVSYCPVVETENKHDAKLIAASPELLAALQACLGGVNNGLARDAYNKATQAIAKALGESK